MTNFETAASFPKHPLHKDKSESDVRQCSELEKSETNPTASFHQFESTSSGRVKKEGDSSSRSGKFSSC